MSESPTAEEAVPPEEEEEDNGVDPNVDELFDQKMRQLKELGLFDDRMMEKVSAINDMKDNPMLKRPIVRRNNGPMFGSHFYSKDDNFVQFKGDDINEKTGETGFTPIANSGIKWSLPIHNRRGRPFDGHSDWDRGRDYDNRGRDGEARDGPNRDTDYDRDKEVFEGETNGSRSRDGFDELSVKAETSDRISSNYDNKYTSDDNPSRMAATNSRSVANNYRPKPKCKAEQSKHKHFEKLFERQKPTVEKKPEVITDIEAFIKDCNKKAEPKPLPFDDIDDFIANANKRLERISATVSARNSGQSSNGLKRKHK